MFSAGFPGIDQLIGGLKKFGDSLKAPVAEAAADALAESVERTRQAEGLAAPLLRNSDGSRQEIGVDDPASIAREFGTLDVQAAPWLAPSLPAAQGPMRAAVVTAVARAISAFRLNAR